LIQSSQDEEKNEFGKRTYSSISQNSDPYCLSVDDPENLHKRLLVASEDDNYDEVEKLLRNGADITYKDEFDETALHKAFYTEEYSTLELLLESGAPINAKNIYGETPLLEFLKYTSSDHNLTNLNITRLLLKHGSEPKARDISSTTPLHATAAQDNILLALELIKTVTPININGRQEFLAFINAQDRDGDTPLHLTNENRLIAFLSDLGADVDIENYKGQTALLSASSENKTSKALLLIELGADLNIQDKCGNTALHNAIFKNNFNLVKALVEGGALIDIENKDNITVRNYVTSEAVS